MNRCARDGPDLIVRAVGLALDDELLRHCQQGQEQINVRPVIRQMADVDLRGAGLRPVVPKQEPIARIPGGRCSVCSVEEQIR